MATVHDVAAALMERVGVVTAMKLEKLVYYCQCWHLVRHDLPIFDEPIEAWRQGPVVPALYQKHKGLYQIDEWPHGDAARLTPSERAVVAWVADNYGGFSAIELSRMTHSELPWKAARGTLLDSERSNEEIRRDVMALYYARQLADPEAAVMQATASSALEGVELDDVWQDRLRDVATGRSSADDLVAEEIARLRRD